MKQYTIQYQRYHDTPDGPDRNKPGHICNCLNDRRNTKRKTKKAEMYKKTTGMERKDGERDQKLYAHLSLLCEIETGSTVKKRKVKQMKRKVNIKKWEGIPAVKEILKQKMQMKAQRLRRLTKRSNFFSFRQNKTLKRR